ncbi:MAG: PrgI family protein [Patescibacteria group bacterium]
MEQHPIPRQITTFEYKLIGFMTIKQFGYVMLGAVFAYAAFLIVPIFILNYITGFLVFCAGLAFAFFPINDRPLDVFIRNLYTRINSPTQFTFLKNNPSLSVMEDLYFESNPHITITHADSKEKLAAYLANKKVVQKDEKDREAAIGRINTVISKRGQFESPVVTIKQPQPPAPGDLPQKSTMSKEPVIVDAQKNQMNTPPIAVNLKHPFFSGTVTNKRNIPLPGVLVYIKDSDSGKNLRILKTNPHGVFATFNPLPPKKYKVEVVDSAGNYIFDPTELVIAQGEITHNQTFVSKETI